MPGRSCLRTEKHPKDCKLDSQNFESGFNITQDGSAGNGNKLIFWSNSSRTLVFMSALFRVMNFTSRHLHEDIWCLSLHFTAEFTVATLSEQKAFVEICIRRRRFEAFMKILSFCLTSIIVRPHAAYWPCLLRAIEIHFGVKILCNFMQIASGMRCSAFAKI